MFEGDHNTPRPQFFYDSVYIFFQNCLLVDQLVKENPDIERTTRKLPEFVDALNGADSDSEGQEDEDEEMRRAIEESLKMTGGEGD